MQYENERKRLAEPYADRLNALWNLSHRAVGPPDINGVFTARGFTSEEHREVMEIHSKIEAGLAEFARNHKVQVEPFDTPSQIANWIEEQEFRWSAHRWKLMEMNGHQISAEEKRAHDTAAARDAYREARARVLSFAKIDADLPRLFPERDDPVIGLQDIKAWTDCFSAEGRETALRDARRHELRKAVKALLGSIQDSPVGREFGDWTKPLISEAASAANKLGLPAPLIFCDYFDMVQRAADSDETGITYIRYTAPHSNYTQTLILQGYQRRGNAWIKSAPGGLSEDWRRDVVRILRMWIRHLDGDLSELPPVSVDRQPSFVLGELVEPEYLDGFRDQLNRASPAPLDLKLPIQWPEKEVRRAFERLLGEPFHATDSGVEMCDTFTLQGLHNGQQVVVAAMFKGAGNKSLKWPLQISGCGKPGNQVVRLFDVPADVYIVQANGPLDPSLVRHIHDTADARAARGRKVRFMLIDGVTTEKLIRLGT